MWDEFIQWWEEAKAEVKAKMLPNSQENYEAIEEEVIALYEELFTGDSPKWKGRSNYTNVIYWVQAFQEITYSLFCTYDGYAALANKIIRADSGHYNASKDCYIWEVSDCSNYSDKDIRIYYCYKNQCFKIECIYNGDTIVYAIGFKTKEEVSSFLNKTAEYLKNAKKIEKFQEEREEKEKWDMIP